MLWGATLRSPLPHARIRRVDASAAAALPGVTPSCSPPTCRARGRFGLNFDDQPVLADDLVRYHGEPVAIVAADTPRSRTRPRRSSTSTWSRFRS